MPITVEFFGIPRARAGVAHTVADGETLGDVISFLAARFPRLADDCFEGPTLKPGYTANLRGDQFTTDPATLIKPNDLILILSLDAGG